MSGTVRTTGGLQAWLRRLRATSAFRAFTGFNRRRGNLLAAGMSYHAVFAIFAALWLGFAAAGIWLSSNPAVLDSVIKTLNRAVPGLIGSSGAVSRSALLNAGGTLGWTGIVAAVGLIATTIGWLSSTRQAIRAMFDAGMPRTHVVLQKLRDLALGLGFGILLGAASILTLVTSAVLGGIFDLLGIDTRSAFAAVATRVASLAVTTAVNAVVLAGMFRVLSGLRIPGRPLWRVSVTGAVVLTAMSAFSGLLLGGAHKNPLAASFAVILGLLIWFNLVCRLLLLCASWLAVGMSDRGERATAVTPEQEPEVVPARGSARRHAGKPSSPRHPIPGKVPEPLGLRIVVVGAFALIAQHLVVRAARRPTSTRE